MLKRDLINLIIAVILASGVALIPANIVQAAATTSITITKYAADGTTVIQQTIIYYTTMKTTLPVQGDGVTHYFHQGPTFDDNNLWDPSETVNLKDQGAVKGTDLKDLCNLVGGMASGDSVQIKAVDNFSKTLDYANIYAPPARQGKVCVCWYNTDYGEVPTWVDGMELIFMAQTTNAAGQYVFGNQDMHDCLPENRWYLYSGQYPSTNGYTVKYINQINIMSTFPPPWDVNNDHACNIGDVVTIGLAWGETSTPGWIPEDLNNDGVINIGDVVVLGLHWGQTW